MSVKNILTGVVFALALILVVVVVLVKTGVFDSFEKPTTAVETIIETSIVVETETNEEGSVEYVTFLQYYPKPKYSSNHTYPTTKKKTTVPVSTTTTVPMLDMTEFVPVTDENGIPQFDENGVPFTEMLTYTIPADQTTTTAPVTEFVPRTEGVVVTNRWGKQETDEDGNPLTEMVTLDAPPTTLADLWSENVQNGTTSEDNKDDKPRFDRDDNLANTIVEQINRDRAAAGLEPLEHNSNLKSKARTNSMALARPDIYPDATGSGMYYLITTYGGNPVYQTVSAANRAKIMDPETTQIGVGIILYEGQYYTTVAFN